MNAPSGDILQRAPGFAATLGTPVNDLKPRGTDLTPKGSDPKAAGKAATSLVRRPK